MLVLKVVGGCSPRLEEPKSQILLNSQLKCGSCELWIFIFILGVLEEFSYLQEKDSQKKVFDPKGRCVGCWYKKIFQKGKVLGKRVQVGPQKVGNLEASAIQSGHLWPHLRGQMTHLRQQFVMQVTSKFTVMT